MASSLGLRRYARLTQQPDYARVSAELEAAMRPSLTFNRQA